MLGKSIAIVGPTASGKTNLSLLLAQVFPLEVVSCDSVQVYREFNIGSAKPTFEELQQVPHHLIDVLEPDERIDAASYKKMAEKAILDIQSRGRIPVVVGGTGMYFNALYEGMYEGVTSDLELRRKLKQGVEKEGIEVYYRKLESVDPIYAAKIASTDERRIIRALEAYEVTKVPFSELHKKNKKLDLDWLIWGLNPQRSLLYEQINLRVDRMIEDGLVEETRSLIENYSNDLQGLESLGYRHCRQYLAGEMDLETMVYEIKRDTRHFAKRQLTWFKKNKNVRWVSLEQKEEIFRVTKEFLAYESNFSTFSSS